MGTINVLVYCLLALEVLFFMANYKKGLGFFLFVFIVFPESITVIDFLSLNITRFSLLIALIFFLRELLIKRTIVFTRFPLRNALIVFCVLLLPSYLLTRYSAGFPRGVYMFLVYFFANNFLAGIILYHSIKSYQDVRVLFKWFLFIILFLGVYGLLEYLTGYSSIFWDLTRQEYKIADVTDLYGNLGGRFGFDNRIKSFNSHPIVYGGRLILFIPMFMLLFAEKPFWKVSKTHTIAGIIFCLLVVNIFLTVTRSGWLSGFISFLIIFIFHRSKFLKTYANLKLATLFLSVLPFVFILLPKVIELSTKADQRGSSVKLRNDQYDVIFNNILGNNIVLGMGPDAINTFIKDDTYPAALGFESILFEVFTSNGVVGFIGYVILYSSILYIAIKPPKSNFTSIYLLALTVSHIVFIILTGERITLFVYFCFVCILLKINHLKSNEIMVAYNDPAPDNEHEQDKVSVIAK